MYWNFSYKQLQDQQLVFISVELHEFANWHERVVYIVLVVLLVEHIIKQYEQKQSIEYKCYLLIEF